jgi:beta-lactamase class A
MRAALFCCVFAALITSLATLPAGNASFADRMTELEKLRKCRIGVVGVDISTNRRVEYRAHDRFLMCSTFKVLAVAAALKRVDEQKEQLDRFVKYGEAQLLEYAPVTRAHVKEGGMTLQALCAAAIEQSDNTAGNLVLETIGGPKGLTEFARKLGDELTRLDRTEPDLNNSSGELDTTTPKSICKDLQRLFTSEFLSAASRERLENWMRRCETGLEMLRATTPRDWQVADKTGRSRDGATNDIAIVRPPSGGPIFIAIYSVNPNEPADKRNELVAEVSKAALNDLSKPSGGNAARLSAEAARFIIGAPSQ